MEDIPFIYVIPLKNSISLFSQAYEDYEAVLLEYEEILNPYKNIMPGDFEIRDHIAHIWGYAYIDENEEETNE